MMESRQGGTRNARDDIEIQITPLSAFDNIMPRMYAYTLYILSTKNGEDISEIHRDLESSLQRTCEDMPFLAGSVRVEKDRSSEKRRGRLEIIMSKSGVPGPGLKFKDLREELDLEDLLEAGIPDEELDANLLLPAGLFPDLSEGAPVLVAQITFLAGGCILGVGVHHSVCDGGGAVTVMKRWTEHLRNSCWPTGDYALSVLDAGALDRGILAGEWQRAGGQHDMRAHEKSKEDLWRFLGVTNISKPVETFHQAIAAIPDEQMVTGIFFISGGTLSSLRAEASFEPDGRVAKDLTANDALMAFLWQSIMRARFLPDNVDDAVEAILDSTVDGRGLFSTRIPAAYVGNVVVINTAVMPLARLIEKSTPLNLPTRAIRTALNEMSQKRIHDAYTLAESLPSCEALSFPFATFGGSELCITSVINNPAFSLDFGAHFGNHGKCLSVRPPRSEYAAICRRCVVLPRRESGGVEVLISMFRSEMDRLVADESFARYASFCGN